MGEFTCKQVLLAICTYIVIRNNSPDAQTQYDIAMSLMSTVVVRLSLVPISCKYGLNRCFFRTRSHRFWWRSSDRCWVHARRALSNSHSRSCTSSRVLAMPTTLSTTPRWVFHFTISLYLFHYTLQTLSLVRACVHACMCGQSYTRAFSLSSACVSNPR